MAKNRPNVVAVRLTPGEIERLDALRGDLTRSQYLRKVLASDAKRTPLGPRSV